MKEETSINISIDTLYEIKQREKAKPQLQKIDPDFYKNLSSYISEKKKNLERTGSNDFSDPEKKRASKELDNIQAHVRKIYEARERKIISMALACSKAGADIVDLSTILPEEKPLFDSLLDQLSHYRTNIFENVKKGSTPNQTQKQPEQNQKNNHHTPNPSPQKQPEQNQKTLTFTQEVPQFLGRNLEKYGPFKKEDIAKIPSEIAKILIEKNKAEEIS